MPDAGITTTNLPFLGGYKVCGNVSVSGLGFMDRGSVNFIQTMSGLETREPVWETKVFKDATALNNFVAAVNGFLGSSSVDAIKTLDGLQIISMFPYKPEQTKNAVLLKSLGNLRYFIVFKIKYTSVYFSAGTANKRQGMIFADLPSPPVAMAKENIFHISWFPDDGKFFDAPVYPTVQVGYFRTFFIVSYPNYYGRMPELFYWFDNPDPADAHHWCWTKWFNSDAPEEKDKLSFAEIPTVFALMTVENLSASFIVWGCSENGVLRATNPLTDELLEKCVSVQKLLCKVKNECYSVPLLGGTAQVANRAMIIFNGALFVFGYDVCYIVSKLVGADAKNPSIAILAPMYQVAPFKGGCLNQEAVAVAWNELYVGHGTGAIYSITRVMESGSYVTADIMAASGVIEKDPDFLFKRVQWFTPPAGEGATTFLPLKFIHLFFDYDNGVLMSHFFWMKQRIVTYNAQEKEQATPGGCLMAYNKQCVEGSTGWSFLGYPGKGTYIVNGGLTTLSNSANADETILADLTIYQSPRISVEDPEKKREMFWPIQKFSHIHALHTPFFAAFPADVLYLYQAMHLSIDRMGVENIYLNLRCTTDLSTPQELKNYRVPALLELDRGKLSAGRLAMLSTQNSFKIGMQGSFFQIIIAEPPASVQNSWPHPGRADIPEANNWNAPFLLTGILLRHKKIGTNTNDATLISLE